MQIGEFGDWNIQNSNSKLISSKNVTCKEEPPSPRGGRLSDFLVLQENILFVLDGCRINWFYYMSSEQSPVSRCVTKGWY